MRKTDLSRKTYVALNSCTFYRAYQCIFSQLFFLLDQNKWKYSSVHKLPCWDQWLKSEQKTAMTIIYQILNLSM